MRTPSKTFRRLSINDLKSPKKAAWGALFIVVASVVARILVLLLVTVICYLKGGCWSEYKDPFPCPQNSTTILCAAYTDELALPFIGNGYLATIINSNSIYIAGLYSRSDSVPETVHRAQVPATNAFFIPAARPSVAVLDLESGVFDLYSTCIGAYECTIRQRWYAHRTRLHLLVHDIEVTSGATPVPIDLLEKHSTVSSDIVLEHTEPIPPEQNDTNFSQLQLYRTLSSEPGCQTYVALAATLPNFAQGNAQRFTVKEHSKVTLQFLTVVHTTTEKTAREQLKSKALLDYKLAKIQTPTQLLEEHKAAWTSLRQHQISVDNVDLARKLNSSWYYLLSSVDNRVQYAPSPGGLATNVYNGHVFWDSEVWMFPNLAVFHPSIAEAHVQYRFNRLEEARRKAAANGYSGAMFPWESACSGEEATPSDWSQFADMEQHISADISFAARLFWHATRNRTWLYDIGKPLSGQIAQFWMSRVTVKEDVDPTAVELHSDTRQSPLDGTIDTSKWVGCGIVPPFEPFTGSSHMAVEQLPVELTVDHPTNLSKSLLQEGDHTLASAVRRRQLVLQEGFGDAGSMETPSPVQYELKWVIAPDEYAVNVSNNAFTNACVKLALDFAVEAAQQFPTESPEPEHIHKNWCGVARGLVVLFDKEQGIHLEYDNYSGATIKQADVILMGYPLQYPERGPIRANDLQYYGARVDADNSPAMTWSMSAIGWLEQGDEQQAHLDFVKAGANMRGPFNIWWETQSGGNSHFITGAGGWLQTLWAGYAGIRFRHSGLHFRHLVLPQDVNMVQLHGVMYNGSQLSVVYDKEVVRVTLTDTHDESLPLVVHWEGPNSQQLLLNDTLEFDKGPFTVTLDGV